MCFSHVSLCQSVLLFLPSSEHNLYRDFTENPSPVYNGIGLIVTANMPRGHFTCGEMLKGVVTMISQRPAIVIEGSKGGDEGGSDCDFGGGRRQELLPLALGFQPFLRPKCREEARALAAELIDSGEVEGSIVQEIEVRYLP